MHFHAQLIKASAVTIACKAAELFAFFHWSIQYGCTIALSFSLWYKSSLTTGPQCWSFVDALRHKLYMPTHIYTFVYTLVLPIHLHPHTSCFTHIHSVDITVGFACVYMYIQKCYTKHTFTWKHFKVFLTRKPNTIRRRSLHQLISLSESPKAPKAHGCKPWATNLLIVPPYIRYTNRKYYLLCYITWIC